MFQLQFKKSDSLYIDWQYFVHKELTRNRQENKNKPILLESIRNWKYREKERERWRGKKRTQIMHHEK